LFLRTAEAGKVSDSKMRLLSTIIAAAALGSAGAPASSQTDQSSCSNETLKGRYVFAGEGIIEAIEPGVQRVHYGTFLFDGRGGMTGKQSSSRGGRIGREMLEGSYQLSSDCSGSLRFRFAGKSETETHWDMYVTGDGRLGHIIRMDDGSMAVRTFQR
jgi:hypothetical protein